MTGPERLEGERSKPARETRCNDKPDKPEPLAPVNYDLPVQDIRPGAANLGINRCPLCGRDQLRGHYRWCQSYKGPSDR